MKKLKLNLKLEGKGELSKEQMKKISGGYPSYCGSYRACDNGGGNLWVCTADYTCPEGSIYVCQDSSPAYYLNYVLDRTQNSGYWGHVNCEIR